MSNKKPGKLCGFEDSRSCVYTATCSGGQGIFSNSDVTGLFLNMMMANPVYRSFGNS